MSIANKLLLSINFLIGLLIFSLPTALLTIPKGGSIAALILILSLVGLVINRDKLELHKWEKYFVFSFMFYFIVVAINLWWFDGDLRDLDVPSRLLLVLPIYFFIRKNDVSINWLIWGIVFGAIVSVLIKLGVINTTYLSNVVTVQTGVFSLFSSIFGLSSLMFVRKGGSGVKNAIFLMAFVFGISASMLSGGRGVWISAFLSLGVILFVNPANWKTGTRFISVFLLFSIFIGAYFIPQSNVKNRVDAAFNNVDSWVESGKSNTSAGARLEMWKASYEIIKQNPVIGVGEGNYEKHQKKMIDRGEIDKSVSRFAHPHSEYVTSFIEQGSIGFLAFLMVLIAPIKRALDAIRHKHRYAHRTLISTTLVIVLHYAFYSFTSGVFDHQSSTLFYATFIAIVLGLMKSRPQNYL